VFVGCKFLVIVFGFDNVRGEHNMKSNFPFYAPHIVFNFSRPIPNDEILTNHVLSSATCVF
jgi:hypothetical protein